MLAPTPSKRMVVEAPTAPILTSVELKRGAMVAPGLRTTCIVAIWRANDGASYDKCDYCRQSIIITISRATRANKYVLSWEKSKDSRLWRVENSEYIFGDQKKTNGWINQPKNPLKIPKYPSCFSQQ